MVQAGKRDRSAFKSSKREQVKLKKRNLKKGKLKEERSDTQSPEIDQICSGNIDDLQITKKGKQATTAEEARNKLMLKKEKRREKVSQGDLDSNKQKKRRETMSQHDLDNTKKKKRREKKTEEWLLDYHQRRPGLEIVQQRLGEFIAAYETEQEQARKDREALAAEGGWTVVVHHKGRKKTTDSESGIAVGSVAPAAVEDKMSKKKQKELALDFYRFQKREAQRNEVMMLQSKFEQDKKRLQQLRAARKFRPY